MHKHIYVNSIVYMCTRTTNLLVLTVDVRTPSLKTHIKYYRHIVAVGLTHDFH